MNTPTFTIIDAIRTYRKEQDLGYEEASAKAIAFFRKKGWPIPEFLNRKYPNKNSSQ
jgi:hypothetical protein